MNIASWIVQVLLEAVNAMTGVLKDFQFATARQRLHWTQGRSDNFVRFIRMADRWSSSWVYPTP